MGFDAASAIQRKYEPILEDPELLWNLAIGLTFHCEENRTAKMLETEFGCLLWNKAHEKGLGWFVDLEARAKGNERKIIQKVLLEKIGAFGRNGLMQQLVDLLKREDLTDTAREAAEDALAEAAGVCGSTGLVNEAIALLLKEGMPEKAQARIIARAGGNPYVEQMKYVDALIKILGGGWAGEGLRRETEAGAKKAVELNICAGRMRNVCMLMRAKNIPWEIVNMVLEGCPGTGYVEWAADMLKKKDVPPETVQVAEKAVLRGLEMCKGQLFGHLVSILRKIGLPEKIYLKAVEAAGNGEGGHGYGYVEALNEILSRRDISDDLRNAMEKALVDGAMEQCAKEGHSHYVSALRKNLFASEKLRVRACEILVEHAGRLSIPPQPGIEPATLTPGGIGAVDSRFRTHSSGRRGGVTAEEKAPTILVELKKATGKKG